MALIATSMYALDRALRLSRFLYYMPTNTATLTPLVASNATRVTLTRSMAHSAPGSHAFLYMPGIRACQTHPFTMVSRDPVEFVISARNGFTKDLFKAACEKPRRAVRTGLEGAYGCVPSTLGYDRVVLFAGGSGATFTFALAVDWAKKQDVESKKSLEFIWSVRTVGRSKIPITTEWSPANAASPTRRLRARTRRLKSTPTSHHPCTHDQNVRITSGKAGQPTHPSRCATKTQP